MPRIHRKEPPCRVFRDVGRNSSLRKGFLPDLPGWDDEERAESAAGRTADPADRLRVTEGVTGHVERSHPERPCQILRD